MSANPKPRIVTQSFDLSTPQCPDCRQPMHVESIKRWDDTFRILTCVSERCGQVGQPWKLAMATGVATREE